MKITIWGDFACPFCYMEEYSLENILKERDAESGEEVEIELKAYELNPAAPLVPVESMTEHFSKEHEITEEEAIKQMARISKMASRVGLNYNLEGVKVCSTFDAHRLMKLGYDIADAETVVRLNFMLFRANFVENRRLSDHSVLTELAVEAGLDKEAVAKTLTSDKYASAVREDEKEAVALGLEFVPYMRFSDGRVLQGILSPGALRRSLSE